MQERQKGKRRIVYVPDIDTIKSGSSIPDGDAREYQATYVAYTCEDPTFANLLWREVLRIKTWCRMSDTQWSLLKCYLQWGLNYAEIARLKGLDESTVRYHIKAALKSAATYPHTGLLTGMIEELGWPQIREYLADALDAKTPRHPRAGRKRKKPM